MFGNCVKLFFMSMIPIWELRGSIIASQAMNPVVPIVLAYAVCVIGNMIPVPFIYVFARRFLKWGVHKKGIGKPCRWILKKGHNGSKKLGKKGTGGVFVALMIFVGIPLPGTGAWTGTLVASFLEFGLKRTFLAILCGVLMAGGIMTTITLVGLKMFGM